MIFLLSILFSYTRLGAQGSWTRVANLAPYYNAGVMLLLSDGSVICKTPSGGSDMYGNMWTKLTPDVHGSYINGTWSVMTSMKDTRLYFSTQVLRDGRVYVAGGEYGTGKGTAEIYDPVADEWSNIPVPAGDSLYDSNSEMLPDGRVLQGIILGSDFGRGNIIFDPSTNHFVPGPSSIKVADETSWVKLADNSIIFIDWKDSTSERYIPALNSWITDGNVPVGIYDVFAHETGPGVLLPDGRAFVIGGNGKTAIYTPSGSITPGTWAAGPSLPNGQGAPDAAAAVMTDGRVLCAASPAPTSSSMFPSAISFYVFDYSADTFIHITTPIGTDTLTGPCYNTHMLNLPDGSILFSNYSDDKYYVYRPSGTPLAAGKPVVDSIIKVSCDTFIATGKGFNGLNMGSYYGDDWQMSTNYPLIRLISGSDVYYTRTYNWNSNGVMRGSAKDTTHFALPAGLPDGSYSLEVVVNGIPSAQRAFKTCNASGIASRILPDEVPISVIPNPASGKAVVTFRSDDGGAYSIRLVDVLGRVVVNETGEAATGKNTHVLHFESVAKGVYTIVLQQGSGVYAIKLVVE